MKTFNYLIFVVFLGSCSVGIYSCDDEDTLPPITMEGKNTFGCLVDGEIFMQKAPPGHAGTHAEIYLRQDTTSVNIYGSDYLNDESIFISVIDFPDLEINNNYDFSDSQHCGVQYINYSGEVSCSYDKPLKGSITFSKLDINKRILSGTFEFEVYSETCKDSVVVTEGRFDIGAIDLD